jgi:endonuclease/exonuclease/phosphatase family protein
VQEPQTRPRTGRLVVVVCLLLPWAWFLLRDRLGLVTDVLAIVLPVLALVVALLVGVIGRRRRAAVAFAVSTLLVGIVASVLPWIPTGAGTVDTSRAIRIAAANIGAGELEGADALIALNADVLIVSEIGEPLTERLSGAFASHVAELSGPAVGVFSRFPITVLERPGAELPGFMVRVEAPSGAFDLVATHVPRPWYTARGPSYQTTFPGHHRLIEQIARRIAADKDPVVFAGDLNTTDRSRDYRLLTEHLDDAMLDGWGRPTQIGNWAPFLVRIDHLLVKPGWCSDNSSHYKVPMSDHRGVIATVGPCS